MSFRRPIPIGRHERLSTDIAGLVVNITQLQERRNADQEERADVERTLRAIDDDARAIAELLDEAEVRLSELVAAKTVISQARRDQYKPKFMYTAPYGYVDLEPLPRELGMTFSEAEVRRRLGLPPLGGDE